MNKVRVKDKIDELMYRAFNLISGAMFFFKFNIKRVLAENSAFKNIHENERCFIMGTGPSLSLLTDDQVEKLRSEVLFGVNSFYKTRFASKLFPKYYGLMDDLYWKELSWVFREVAGTSGDTCPTFVTDPRAKEIVDGLDCRGIYVYSKKFPIDRMTEDITGNNYITMNVVSTCILVAIYMGFKEIYLMGCDYNFFGGTNGHCYDDKDELEGKKDFDGFTKNLAFYLKFFWWTTEFHYLIAKLGKEKGVKVVNLAPGSLLDAYPRKPVSDVL